MLNFEKVPFQEAIDYLRSKVPIPTTQWDQMYAEYADASFSIAGITSGDLLNDLMQAVIRAEEQGTGFDEFQRSANEAIADYGSPTPLTANRLNLVYSQNLDNAYGAARAAQMNDPAIRDSRPYRMWRHVAGQQHPRPAHEKMDSKVFHQDDAIAQTILPCGFSCKCRWLTLSDRDLKDRNLTVSEPIDQHVMMRDRITGEKYKLPAIEVDGELHPIVEPGFQNQRGLLNADERRSLLMNGLNRLPVELREQAKSAIDNGIPRN